MKSETQLLRVNDLRVQFGRGENPARAVDGVSFDLREGETLALVGESGSGKSVTALSLARLVPQPQGRYASGEISYRGGDVLKLADEELRELRGGEIAYIFQEPSSSLNPVMRVEAQIRESLRLHRPDADAENEIVELLTCVGLPDAQAVARKYPHELSGGMQQRIMIAMALASRPKLLIADEPTTALDVTVQAQILTLLASLQKQFGMAILLITHNLGLVAEVARRVAVMYAGKIVEQGPVEKILREPRHPYTKALLQAVPRIDGSHGTVQGIEGLVPDPRHLPTGCTFHPRCVFARERCKTDEPVWETENDRNIRCHFWREL
jgi:oligopeptide/dipeptide ABC transporter ATP-binding protein